MPGCKERGNAGGVHKRTCRYHGTYAACTLHAGGYLSGCPQCVQSNNEYTKKESEGYRAVDEARRSRRRGICPTCQASVFVDPAGIVLFHDVPGVGIAADEKVRCSSGQRATRVIPTCAWPHCLREAHESHCETHGKYYSCGVNLYNHHLPHQDLDAPDCPACYDQQRQEFYSNTTDPAVMAKHARALKAQRERHKIEAAQWNERREVERKVARQQAVADGSLGICPECRCEVRVAVGVVLQHNADDKLPCAGIGEEALGVPPELI